MRRTHGANHARTIGGMTLIRGSAGMSAALVLAALLACTGLVALLENVLGVPNASSAYLLAVVTVAVLSGTARAVATSVGAFLAYDFLFTQPLHTLFVTDAGEWLNLVLLLVVGIVVGQLAGLQRQRATAALAREREALGLFQVSRALATARDTSDALPSVLAVLAHEADLERAWAALGQPGSRVRIAADSSGVDAGPPPSLPATHFVLQRRPGDEPARWVRVHAGQGASGARHESNVLRIGIEIGARELGAIWCLRPRRLGLPGTSPTRLLSAAADQIGQGLERDRLALEATSAEVARRSDALKSALLDSVSHDLRTPLASIRAAAGSLMDPGPGFDPEEERSTARAIDREAERLNRLVSNLLDLSRIEAGGLKPQTGVFVLADLVSTTLSRLGSQLAGRRLEVALPEDLPPVRVDDVYMDQVLTNLLENAARYTPGNARLQLFGSVETTAPGEVAGEPSSRADIRSRAPSERVVLTLEDDGPGVPDDALGHLFDKFYRAPQKADGARRGTGIGLTVVRGLLEAMDCSIVAHRSSLGGLAFDISMPAAEALPGTLQHDLDVGASPGRPQPPAPEAAAALVTPVPGTGA
jgi:two-component system, OmpR family, sensor histidine kinase KdpD